MACCSPRLGTPLAGAKQWAVGEPVTELLKRRCVPGGDEVHVLEPHLVVSGGVDEVATGRDAEEELVHVQVVVHRATAERSLPAERVAAVMQVIRKDRICIRFAEIGR